MSYLVGYQKNMKIEGSIKRIYFLVLEPKPKKSEFALHVTQTIININKKTTLVRYRKGYWCSGIIVLFK